MYYLSIETSCDETSLALLRAQGHSREYLAYLNSFEVVSHVVSSQIDVHREFGGVVPEIGAREHAQHIHLLFKLLLARTKHRDLAGVVSSRAVPTVDLEIKEYREILENIQEIFVTTSPGLISALRVGYGFAQSLQFYLPAKPKITEVNHLHGHLVSCFYDSTWTQLKDTEVFPHLHLLVSGGNSQLLLVRSPVEWKIIGATLDDAAGESFDKAGRLLGLPYPAGVSISKIAGLAAVNIHDLPRGMLKQDNFNYSFSGLKTAVRYYVQKQPWPSSKRLSSAQIEYLVATELNEITDLKLRFVKEMCLSLQFVVAEQLVRKFRKAIEHCQPKSIGLSGGVSANPYLRQEIQKLHTRVFITKRELTGDNAVMIGLSGLTYTYLK